MRRANLATSVCGAALALACGAAAAAPPVERPFMIWNRRDIELLAAKVKSQPWARQRLERLLKEAPSPEHRGVLENYFLYLLTGDKAAEQYEKQVMLHVAEVLASPRYAEGRSIEIGASFSIRNYDLPFRYDLFGDAIQPVWRRVCESKFNKWCSDQLKNDYSYRGGWESPYPLFNSLMALALGDRRLAQAAFDAPSGPKAYFDGMVDGYFTPHGFDPNPNCLGAMWLWCRGVERLGLNELGFGYVGKTGGTMRRLLAGYLVAGDPKIDIPGGMAFYGRSAATLSRRLRRANFFEMPPALVAPALGSETAGTGGQRIALPKCPHPRDVFRAPTVVGQLRGGTGSWPALLPFRNELFYSYDKKPRDLVGMPQIEYNRGMDPLSLGIQLPLVFELAHQRWPDAGFDYFLCRMQPPEDGWYYPSLLWGLDPIRAADAKAPAVQSIVLPGLGMALLRAEHGPAFWDSPAPFAVLRLTDGMGDDLEGSALSLHSFQAFNRPLYYYVTPPRGVPRMGDTGKPYSTVVVDNGRRPGVGKASVRQRFTPAVKFVSVRSEVPPPLPPAPPPPPPPTATEPTRPVRPPPPANAKPIFPGVEMERALVLTREYLVDVYRLAGEKEHTYDWMVHALGSAAPDRPDDWKPTEALNDTLLTRHEQSVGRWDQRFSYWMSYPFGDQRLFDTDGAAWSLSAVQAAAAEDPAETLMGPDWYARKVGVRITMLGQPGTRAFFAREVRTRQLTPAERDQMERIRFPHRLGQRGGGYDRADHERTEIPILPPGGVKPPPEKKLTAKDFKPVGQPVGELPETGGVAIVAERRAARTMFVALHEPFEKMAWSIDRFRRIQQTDDAVAVAIRGRGASSVDDRVLVRMGPLAAEPITLTDGAERFTFTGFACVRVGAEQVAAWGDLAEMKLKVRGTPKLLVNGQERKGLLRDGWLSFGP